MLESARCSPRRIEQVLDAKRSAESTSPSPLERRKRQVGVQERERRRRGALQCPAPRLVAGFQRTHAVPGEIAAQTNLTDLLRRVREHLARRAIGAAL